MYLSTVQMSHSHRVARSTVQLQCIVVSYVNAVSEIRYFAHAFYDLGIKYHYETELMEDTFGTSHAWIDHIFPAKAKLVKVIYS